MGVLDKIKNALFEVEYVEVEEKPKKEKKVKSNDLSEKDGSDKPIVKKIVLPGRKEEKVEEIQEEELKDEDFEIRPKAEVIKEVFKENFNVMDDDDYPVPEVAEKEEIPQPVVETTPVQEEIRPVSVSAQVQSPIQPVYQEPFYSNKDYVREYDSYKEKVYNTIHDDYRVKTRDSRPYGMDPSYQVSIKEYGSENRDDKGLFRPSPIISPIYGILDKNYKKEDVVSKKEIRITSSYARTNLNVDDIRNKAYGRRSIETVEEEPIPEKKSIENVFEIEPEDENLLVDLTDEKKPEVKEITVGDALEYYHDLGLEYNVDYVDASSKNAPKPKTDDLEEDIKDTIDNSPAALEEPVIEKTEEVPQEDITPTTEPEVKVEEVDTPEVEVINEPEIVEEKPEIVQPEPVSSPEEEPVVSAEQNSSEEKTEGSKSDDNDNLFDLIDSMYKEDE